jgi:hypothetical protein
MTLRNWRKPLLAVAAAVLCGGPLLAADPEKKAPRDFSSFGALRSPEAAVARTQAQEWLQSLGKADDKAFAAIWDSDRLLLDKVSETLALGNADAAKLLAESRDPNGPAPTAVPAVLKEAKKDDFLRANLALAYARNLSNRRIYEEALDTLRSVKAEQVVDPASYFFHKAVCEHALMLKREADDSIIRLLDDVGDAPERYKMVAALMHFDMLTWQDKDLGWIYRKMDNSQRRLDLNRGGPATQKIQKEIVVRLDEMIKELENRQKNGNCNGGNCPGGAPGNGGPPSGSIPSGSPATDSALPNGNNPGMVDMKKVKELAEVWGKLQPKEQAERMRELTRNMPPKYREAVEDYFKQIAIRSGDNK